jgi:fumarylpyruvate hydrolase
MNDYVIPAWSLPAVPVAGSDQTFPVRHIYCVGRNYAAHTREMGKDPDREPPFFFTKAADMIAPGGGDIPYPPRTEDMHHEIELVVAIGVGGRDIQLDKARDHIFGYAIGVDLTRRDLQGVAKAAGRPWDTGKQFSKAAPIGAIHPASDVGHLEKGAITFAVNGESRQAGDLGDMIWSIEEIITELSTLYDLMPGDLIYTGTPAGVGALVPGDIGEGRVEGLGDIRIEIVGSAQ